MTKNKKIAIVLIVLAVLLGINVYALKALARKHFSGKFANSVIASPAEFSTNLKLISPEDLDNLQETSIRSSTGDGMVIAISESQNPDILQAVFEDGFFVRWKAKEQSDIANQRLFSLQTSDAEIKKLPVYMINACIGFNNDGSYLITPNKVLSDGLSGYVEWNTETIMSTGIIDNNYYQSLAIYPTRDLDFQSTKKSVGFYYGFASENAGGGLILTREDEEPDLARIAVDPLGDYFAVVDESGEILAGDISLFKNSDYDGSRSYLSSPISYQLFNLTGNEINTVDLKFDQTHSWLAWLTDEDIVIWSLKNYVFPLHLRKELKGGNTISFDRTGRVLAVATLKGITIFDVENKIIIREYPVGEVTALYFSRDNRLLIWGDTEGNVHLWGVPQN
jgi:hypothetical protein